MFLSTTMWCVITRLDLVLLLLATPVFPFEVFPHGTMVYASLTCEQCNNAKQSQAVQWKQPQTARRLLSGSVTLKAAAAPSFMTISLPPENVSVFTPTVSLVPPLQAPAATPDPSSDSETAKPPVPPEVTPATTVLVPDPSAPAVSDPSDGSKTASFPPPAIPVRAENPPAAVNPTPPVFSVSPARPPVSPAIPVMDTKPSAPMLSPPALLSDPVTAHNPPAAAAAPITMTHGSTPPVSPAIPVMDTEPSPPKTSPAAEVSDPSDGSKTPPVTSFSPISPTPPVTLIRPVPPPVSPATPVMDTKPSAPPPLIVPPSSAPLPFRPPLFIPPFPPTQLVQPPPSSLASSAPTTLLQQPPSPSSSAPSQSISESPAAIPTTTPPTTSLMPQPSSSSPPSQSPPSPTTLFQPPLSSSPSTAVMPIGATSSPPTTSMQPPSLLSSPPPSPTAESPAAVIPISTPTSAPTTALQPPPSSPPSSSTAESPAAVMPISTPTSAPTTALQPPPSSPPSSSTAEPPAVMPISTPSSSPTTSLQPPPSSPPSPSTAESPAVMPILTPLSAPTTSVQPPYSSPSAAESPILTPSSPPATSSQPPPTPSAAESPAVLTPLSAPTISMQQPPSSSSSAESPTVMPILTPSSSPPAFMQPPRSSSSPSSPATASPAVLPTLTPPSSPPASMQPPTSVSLEPISPSSSSQGPQMANPVPSPFISNAPEETTMPLAPIVPRRIAPAPVTPLQRQPARSPLTSPAETVSPSLSPKASTTLAPPPGLANAIVPAAAAPVLQGILSPVAVLASPPKARPPQPPAMIFFPPPPNSDCHKQCTDPYVTTLPGGPCDCVIPIRVGLALAVPVYGFLPLVSELAKELAAGTFLLQSQVQIVGANAVGEDLDNTEVQFSLVPLLQSFDNATAVHIAQRFWTHQVFIDEALFGNYTVLYVLYPGLPSFNQGSTGASNGQPTNGNTFTEQPLGVDIQKKKSPKFGAGIIVVITLICAIAALLSLGLIWFLVTKCHRYRSHASLLETTVESSITRRSVALLSSSSRSSSLSFASSFAPFTGSVRTFSLSELEKATENFKPSNVIGEGGFGRVYYGVLEDQTKIAVKVLIRDDHQGDREFAAEVEMLSRLHHRNLVKLVGICTEDRMRSLVYELIRNGSVDSHLHGADKEIASLNWEARLKIALGAARALAYLHEDSFPRVIHRDFKSSNILLEEDFTPKVSDFGLAKAASEELTGHISTRVMGTFGYVAPEYAMTGHLLVKSDVYSYGVVLLELLSGRRPVDMSRPPGQENLVTWARPLLTGREGLQILMDPDLEGNVSSESLARVAVIASMCVQPEVSHRPFMSEVVQALKLVWNDTDDGGDEGDMSTTPASDNGYVPRDWDVLSHYRSNSGGAALDRRPLSSSAILSNSSRLIRQFSGSFGRHSDPERPKTMSGITGYPKGGSVSEHGINRYKGGHRNQGWFL